jgi:hypothetical protein
MGKRALIPALLGFGLLWNFFANIDWVVIHTFKPQMTPSIGQVIEKYKKKSGQLGIGGSCYFITVQGIKSPYCGGKADVDIRFFEQVKVKDQIPILVREDFCYVPEDLRWSRDFLSYYCYCLLSGFAGFALIGYAIWKGKGGKLKS